MKRPELPHRPLTIAEAAEYLGYRTTAGIRCLVKTDLTASGTPTRIPRLETLCRSSRITFVTET
jgi:hypothetical protein